jgi:hypothetical protein
LVTLLYSYRYSSCSSFHAVTTTLLAIFSILLIKYLRYTSRVSYSGPEYLSRNICSLRSGRSGDHIPVGWGGDFSPLSKPVLGCTLYNEYRVFSGDKAAGAWRLPPTPSSAKVKERVVIPLFHLWAFVASSGMHSNVTFIQSHKDTPSNDVKVSYMQLLSFYFCLPPSLYLIIQIPLQNISCSETAADGLNIRTLKMLHNLPNRSKVVHVLIYACMYVCMRSQCDTATAPHCHCLVRSLTD